MVEKREPDFKTEAYYSMKNINYMQRQALQSIKEMIDNPATSPEETIQLIRKTCLLYVPDRQQD